MKMKLNFKIYKNFFITSVLEAGQRPVPDAGRTRLSRDADKVAGVEREPAAEKSRQRHCQAADMPDVRHAVRGPDGEKEEPVQQRNAARADRGGYRLSALVHQARKSYWRMMRPSATRKTAQSGCR